MKKFFLALAAISLLSLAASTQAQNNYYVDVTNNTGFTVYYLYVSPADAQSWEEDVLGDDVIMNGETYRVTLSGYNSSIFDIRLVDEDDDTYTFMGVNVATQDLNVSLADLDAN